jgi:hypothetical protein
VDMVLLGAGALTVGASAAVGAAVGDTERVAQYWAAAEVAADGRAQITEVIDYDFGPEQRRGIRLDVFDLDLTAPVAVSSPTAPDAVLVSPIAGGTNIRIGDPDVTISGRHRYQIQYPLLVRAGESDVSWNAVGTHWEVGIETAEIHLVGPFEWHSWDCFQGALGSTSPCGSVEQVEPGHLVVTTGRIPSGEGVTVDATLGARLDRTPTLDVPAGAAEDPGAGLATPAGVAAVAALLAAAPVSRLVRRAGRERVAVGGAADAAWATGPIGAPDGERLVDHDELASLATIEVAPPGDLTPSHGGVILAEAVTDDHKVAWLIEAAIDGEVDLDERGSKTVLRRTGTGQSPAGALLAPAFGGRSEITLGTYDPKFASAWSAVGTDLADWKRTCGLWDPAGHRRQTVARVLGALGIVVGLAAAFGGGAAANRWGGAWLALLAVGAAVAGAATAALVRSWELKVRTPGGAAAWLRVESFRRFLAGSEAYHAQQAAERGVLREYTAWAVAVGEVRRWSRAVAAAGIPAAVAGATYASIAPTLASSASSTATAPSSSGGGGGGGSVGGGSGGSGGGSW